MTHNPMRPKINSMRSDMMNSQTDQEKFKAVEEAVQRLVAQGRLYDTGMRRWSERTQTFQVVWAAVPNVAIFKPKTKNDGRSRTSGRCRAGQPLRCEDKVRRSMQISAGDGPPEVLDARWSTRQRCSTGQSEWQLQARSLYGRNGCGPPMATRSHSHAP
jgi:hypothetical protein